MTSDRNRSTFRRHRKSRLGSLVAVTMFLTGIPVSVAGVVRAEAPASGSSVVVSEIQTGGCDVGSPATCIEDPRREFVELYNQVAGPLDMTGWQLQYLSASGMSTTTLALFDGQLSGHDYALISHAGYLDDVSDMAFGDASDTGKLAKSSGHIRLVDAQGVEVDRVGWGKAATPRTSAAVAPAPGGSVQRSMSPDGMLADTGDNGVDFVHSDTATPDGGGYQAHVRAQPEDPGSPVAPDTPADPAARCENIAISELLPNPAGADTGHEYIELRNTSETPVDLAGCSLQSSADDKTYAPVDITLGPGEYRAFSDSDTGLGLPNASGGTVWLLAGDIETGAATYPGDMADGVAWASVDGSWVQTFTPTPGAANSWTATEPCPAGQERSADSNRCVSQSDALPVTATTPVACKPGQERNPETNRCRAITASPASLTPCKPGQSRNVQTNRCANIAAGAGTGAVQGCKPGQERNPDTNRCRALTTAAATKPCPTGQERNLETNRCRKISATTAGAIAKVQDVRTPMQADNTRWVIGGLLATGAVAYGIYEWRHEIMQRLRAFRGIRTPIAGRT